MNGSLPLWVWSPLPHLSQPPRTRSPPLCLTQPSQTRSLPSKTTVDPQQRARPPPIFSTVNPSKTPSLFDEHDLQKELWRTKPPVRSLTEREREDCLWRWTTRLHERLIRDCFGEGKQERESGYCFFFFLFLFFVLILVLIMILLSPPYRTHVQLVWYKSVYF